MASVTSVSSHVSRAAETAQESRWAGISLVASVLLAACGHLMIKHGLNTVGAVSHDSLPARILEYLLTPWVMVGLAVYGAGTLLWIAVASKRDISYLYPISAVNYVLITLGAVWLFGEAVSLYRWLGILVVVTGVAVLQISSGERKS